MSSVNLSMQHAVTDQVFGLLAQYGIKATRIDGSRIAITTRDKATGELLDSIVTIDSCDFTHGPIGNVHRPDSYTVPVVRPVIRTL